MARLPRGRPPLSSRQLAQPWCAGSSAAAVGAPTRKGQDPPEGTPARGGATGRSSGAVSGEKEEGQCRLGQGGWDPKRPC